MATHDSVLDSIHGIWMGLETAIKNHYASFLIAIDTQRSVVERMQTLAQRYNILVKSLPSKRTYPKELCLSRVEDDIRSDFHANRSLLDECNIKLSSSLTDIMEKYSCLNESMKENRSLLDECNIKLSSSVTDIMEKYSCLNESMKEMDECKISCLCSSDNARPPAGYSVELFGDFLKFFKKIQSRLNCFAALITPDNLLSLNTYKKQLEPNKDFKDHFSKCLAYCRCLHSKAKT